MSNTEINNIRFDLPKNQSNVIKVIGVGGGGSNAVNHMYSQGIKGVDFVICNTDAQALQNSAVPNKIQLGVSLTEGLGAGAKPEVGEKAALENIQEIKDMLATNSKMVFITVGMGGGTGTGAAPVIAKVARELELLTIGIVTTPFNFEGKKRNEQAQKGIEKMREYVDSLIVINNNKLREVYGNLGFKAGFSKADEVLSTAARGIAEVITHHYKHNIDLEDAKTVLSNSGTAIMGSATVSGNGRAEKVISEALESPLLNDNKITGAKNVLLLIVSGIEEITFDEIGEINDFIQAEAKSDVNIILGIGEDKSLEDAISVTVVATGFNKDQQHEISNTEPKKIIHTLEGEQEAPYEFKPKKLDSSIKNEEANTTSEEKIVYELEEEKTKEEKEKNINIIPTTNLIKNIDVVYEEVLATKENLDDFVITSITPKPKVEIEEPTFKQEKQTSLFDLPITKKEKPSTAHIEEIKVLEHEEVKPKTPVQPQKIESEKHFNLEDYMEVEEHLNTASNPQKTTKKDSENEDESLQISLKTATKPLTPKVNIEEQEVEYKEVSPLDLTISELKKYTEVRKEKMKKFNYKFNRKVSKNIDEIEREPAYKRMGVILEETEHSSDISASRTTLKINENEEIQLKSNNSFLHDNVD